MYQEVYETTASEPKEWMDGVLRLSDEQLQEYLGQWEGWTLPLLPNLSVLEPLVLRVIALATAHAAEVPTLLQLLSSLRLLQAASLSPLLPNQALALSQVLALDHWPTIIQALSVLLEGVEAPVPSRQAPNPSIYSDLAAKAYALAMGGNLNSPAFLPLGTLNCPDFTYKQGDITHTISLSAAVPFLSPEEMFAWNCRQRVKQCGDEVAMIRAQVLGAGVLMRTREEHYLGAFWKSGPERWMIPELMTILHSPRYPACLHSDILSFFRSLLQFSRSVHSLLCFEVLSQVSSVLSPAQSSGLLQCLLRDIAENQAELVPQETADWPEFGRSVLRLVGAVCVGARRGESVVVQMVVPVMVDMLKKGDRYAPELLVELSTVLSAIIHLSISRFREFNGLETVLNLLISCLSSYLHCFLPFLPLIHSLFHLIETILHRWDQPRSLNHCLSLIATSPLIDHIHEVFSTRRFEVFQPCLNLISLLLDELPSLYGELKGKGVIATVIEAMEGGEGGGAVVAFARLLAQILNHSDGASLLESTPLLSRTLNSLFSAPFSECISQLTLALHEVSQRLPALRQLLLDTCIRHLTGLLDSALYLSKEEYWGQIGHMGGLLMGLMQHGGEVMEEFLRRGGLDVVLGLVKACVVPVTVEGGLRVLEPCLQTLNGAQTELATGKVVASIVEIVDRLEALMGPLRLAEDLSSLRSPALTISPSDYLLCSLSSLHNLVQAYVILLRLSGAALSLLSGLLPCIAALGQLYRLLIYEEVRVKESGEPREQGEMWGKLCPALGNSIQTLLKMMTGVGGARGREEETVLGVAVCVSETLCAVLGKMKVETGAALELAFCHKLLTSLSRSLFHRSTSLLLLLSFQASCGLHILTSFLQSLQCLSPALRSSPQAPQLEALWTAAGQFYECVAMWEWTGRMGSTSMFNSFGVRSAGQGDRGLKIAVLEAFEALGYVKCAGISTGFMKSVFEVLSSLFASLKIATPSRVNPLLEMGFSTNSIAHALSRGRNIEAATDWLLRHPQAAENNDMDWRSGLEEKLNTVGEVLVCVVEINPALSSSLASLLAPLSNSHPVLAASLTHQLLACTTLYLSVPLTPYPLIKQIALLSASSPHILKMMCESDLYERLVGAIKFISALETAPEPGTLEPIFSLLTALVGKGTDTRLDLIEALAVFVNRETTLKSISTPGDYIALLELLAKATVPYSAAASFLQAQGLYHLLQLERGEIVLDRKAITGAVESTVRQLVEDEGVLERRMREAAGKLSEGREVLEKMDKEMRKDIGRGPEVAVRAMQSVASFHQSPTGLRVSLRAQSCPASQPISPLGLSQFLQALSLLHQRPTPSLLPPDLLLCVFGDNLRRFPGLFALVQDIQFPAYDSDLDAIQEQPLITHLIKTIFPCYLRPFIDCSENDSPSFPVSKALNGLLAACPEALFAELTFVLRTATDLAWLKLQIACLRLLLKEVQAAYKELVVKVVDKEYGYLEIVEKTVGQGGEGSTVIMETMEILIRLELLAKAPVLQAETPRFYPRPGPNARLFDPGDPEFHPEPDFSPIPSVPSDSSLSPIPSEGPNGRVHFSRNVMSEDTEEELATGPPPPFGPRLMYYRHQTMMPHYEEGDYLDLTLQVLRRRHHYPSFYSLPSAAPDLAFQTFISQCQALAQPELLPPPLPSHIDSSFLDALPENIRREVLHTLQRPPSRDNHHRPPWPEGPIVFGRPLILPGYSLTKNAIVEIAHLGETLYTPSEEFLQGMWDCVSRPLSRHNREVMGELLVAVSVKEGRRVVEGLMRAMERGNGQEAAQVVDQVLCFLQLLLKRNPFISPLFFASGSSSDLPLLHLISLLSFPLYSTNSTQQFSLLSLLSVLLQECTQFPPLPLLCISHICGLLFTDIQDKAFMLVSELVRTVGKEERNREEMEKIMGEGLVGLARELEERLGVRGEASLTGKMVQVLRLCKVIKTVNSNARLPELQGLWVRLGLIFQAAAEETESSRLNPKLARILPLVEAFFVAHNDTDKEGVTAFFTPATRKILNVLIKENPNLLVSSLSHLAPHFSSLLEFDNKREYFRVQLKKLHARTYGEAIRLKVNRNSVLADSFNRLKGKGTQEWLGRLEVDFQGEEGLDLGGPTREWFSLISQDIFNPNYALFILAANGVSFQPNPRSYINPDHLDYFNFIGRVIGKALLDGLCLEVHFTRSFYKHILGQEVTVSDMEDLDTEMYKGLQDLLSIDMDSSEVFECYFAYEEEHFGTVVTKELVPNGKMLRVTEKNKGEYVKHLCSMKMTDSIQVQITAFLAGLYSLIPQGLLGLFDAKELELIIAGIQEIDVSDLREHTEYQGYGRDTPTIKWFWEIVDDMAPQQRALLLQFVTGSSKVPLEGFKALRGSSGIQRFQIHKSYAGPERLPTAHTCFNQLDLPEYPCKEVLRDRLLVAINEGSGYFGLV